ncbi:hypothetical protein HD553DRAFT_317436 [Filobasidium floriforme]|uniref:uncharacterized protein n=1 Tax=Filobasidium floriforme TaxID=5210 RepID=UPI001E8EC88D|nr:uncharacterized protein HD553DRAFT_317436 [Filobasidium floriforme]KAH8080129.1 hypothetical protein HD553DRAFT_317436 [Filobasidium floriforme]
MAFQIQVARASSESGASSIETVSPLRTQLDSWKETTLAIRANVIPSTQDTLFYCKCMCFDNFTIVPLYMPDNPSKPCLSCTRQFCLDQKLPICRGAEVPDLDTDTGTGKEGDVEARCFKRDSPRDQLVVTCFILIVVGLLLTAAIRNRLQAAIAERGRPTDLREWSEALLPTNMLQTRQLGAIPAWIRGVNTGGGTGYGRVG